ncbi:MAG TPA: MBL fold metallo-hydrolase [Candidatus Nitrosotenuis sp.]|jgi:glyoxylase-like metal-dependent hydrolase (beta-lactamase superfamily II)|nr:MBL fold metallo-hydrolase [Candidatus Nitrosotenuis sp.]
MIIRTYPVGPFQMNCYLVADEATRQGVLIDPGDETEWLLDQIQREGVQIQCIYLTHAHIDHVARAQEAKQALGVPLYVHEADAPLLKAAPQQALMLGLRPGPPVEPDGWLREGEVSAGPLTFRVLHTPGHSPGGVTLVIGDHAFVGDAIFAGSIGRTDLPGGDLEVLLRSIKEKILTLGDQVILHPGHGPATTVGEERRSNPFLQEGRPLWLP